MNDGPLMGQSSGSTPTSQFSGGTVAAKFVIIGTRLLRPVAIRIVAVWSVAQKSVLVWVVAVSTGTGPRGGGCSSVVWLGRDIATAGISEQVALAGVSIEATVAATRVGGARGVVVSVRAVAALVPVLVVSEAAAGARAGGTPVGWRWCVGSVGCHGVYARVLAGKTDGLTLSDVVSDLLIGRHRIGKGRRGAVGVGVGIVLLLPVEKTHFELVARRSKL